MNIQKNKHHKFSLEDPLEFIIYQQIYVSLNMDTTLLLYFFVHKFIGSFETGSHSVL